MKKNKLIIIILAVLVVITAALTAAHLATRQQAVENGLQIVWQGKTTVVALDKLTLTAVQGTTVNGKGETQNIDGAGISLSDLLAQAGVPTEEFTAVQVVSDDEYTATLQREEVYEEGKAYLLVDEEGARLVVFGDDNSKRRVKNVVRITLEG